MDGQFDEADKIFKDAFDRIKSTWELNTIQYRPKNPKKLDEVFGLRGKVITVKAGYSIISAEGYPRILCPASKVQRRTDAK